MKLNRIEDYVTKPDWSTESISPVILEMMRKTLVESQSSATAYEFKKKRNIIKGAKIRTFMVMT